MPAYPIILAIIWFGQIAGGGSDVPPCAEGLARVFIHADNRYAFDRQHRRISITVIGSDSTHRCQGEINVRGSSSANREKKPYRLELQDENGDDLNLSLLGMPKNLIAVELREMRFTTRNVAEVRGALNGEHERRPRN